MEKETINALHQLRKEKPRKFDQTIELIINLQKFDVKKESVNLFINLPYPLKKRKICGFLTKKNVSIDTLVKSDFERFKGKKEIKKLVKAYDFFIAHASLMPAVATTFGKYLGPAGKMPSPQLGIVTSEDDATINSVMEKVSQTVRVKSKEPSLKVAVGKFSMKDEEIVKNTLQVYNAVINAVSKEKIKSTLLKFTMSKPMKVL